MKPSKKSKNKVIKRPQFLDKVILRLRQTRLGNSIDKYLRNLKSTYKFQVDVKKSFVKSDNKIRKSVFVVAIILLVVLIFAVFNLNKYFAISPSTYIKNDNSYKDRLIFSEPKEYNVVFLGFDDSKADYRYLKFVVMTSMNTKTGDLRTYGINPNFLVNIGYDQYPLSSAYNLLDKTSPDRMRNLMNLIEKLMGVRIDRYIAFDYGHFQKFADLNQIVMPAPTSFKTPNKFYTKDDSLASGDLYDYMFDVDSINDVIVSRYVYFINFYFNKFKDPLYCYSEFLKADQILSQVSTDMSKDEVLSYFNGIANANTPFSTGNMLTNFTVNPPPKIEDGIPLSDTIADEDIHNIFANLNVIREQAKMEVYNATDQAGFAYNKKRVYENLGSTVIKIGNYSDQIDETELYVPNKNPQDFKETIKMIQNDLQGNVKIIIGDYKYNYSGDLILLLGKDAL